MMLDRLTYTLAAVAPFDVVQVWPMVCGMIDRAYAEVDSPMPGDLVSRLKEGRALLWTVIRSDHAIVYAFITELYLRRSGTKVCMLVAGAGEDMKSWLHLQSQLEDYARAEGCSKIVAEGRVGWARALSGYTEIRRVIEKDL